MGMTVGEYAKDKGISVQAVYQRIKTNKLDTEIKDGVKYIINNEETKNNIDTNFLNDVKEENKELKKEIKSLNKQLKKLNKQLNKEKDNSIIVLKQFISEVQRLEHKKNETIVDTIIEEPKKKKSKKKK